jgi:hypothetical protein
MKKNIKMDIDPVYHHLSTVFPNVLKPCRHQITIAVRDDITVSIAIPVYENFYEIVLIKDDRIFCPSKRCDNVSDIIAEVYNITEYVSMMGDAYRGYHNEP